MHLASLICLFVFAECFASHSVFPIHDDKRELFENFKQTYKKHYTKGEEEKRFEIFKENLLRARKFQDEDKGTAIYGITQFSDLTLDEFKVTYINSQFEPYVPLMEKSIPISSESTPESFDWRHHGAVSPVTDQGACGSCWASSVVGNIEGQWFRKTGKLLTLSRQQVVDCDLVDDGCEGGDPQNVYGEIQRVGGLQLESDYPYQGTASICDLNWWKLKAYITDSIYVPQDEKEQAAWLASKGPIASALNAEPLQFYVAGIIHPPFSQCPPAKLNHAALTVGYGTKDGMPFWIVKNNWGVGFGEEGYFRIYRGDGTCGINSLCTTAVI